MRRLALVAAILGALAAPSSAAAGGMAAWTLSGPPAGLTAGDAWHAQIRVTGCRGVLLGSITPTVVVVDNRSGRIVRFRGRSTGVPGEYTARVVFPTAGNWSYRVEAHGLRMESFGPYRIAAPAQKPDRLVAALPPIGAVVLVLGTGLVLRRRRRA
jgi:hypothetical protein